MRLSAEYHWFHRRSKAPRTEVRSPATCHRHARRHAPQRAQRHGDDHDHNHCAVLEGLNSHCRHRFGVAQFLGGPLGGHAESDGLDDGEGVHGPAARAWVGAISGVWFRGGYGVRARFRAWWHYLARIVGSTPVTPPRNFMTGMAGLGAASARRSALAVETKSRKRSIVVVVVVEKSEATSSVRMLQDATSHRGGKK